MAKIYISYNQQDSPLARELAYALQQRGHQVAIDIDSLAPGADWRAVLNDALKQSDAFVAILTQAAMKSQYVASEIGAARAYAQAAGEMLVIPVIADDMAIPPFVSDLFAIVAPDRDTAKIIGEIERALTSFAVSKAAREKKQEDRKQQLETNAATYVEETMTSLLKNESRDRLRATIWYSAGLFALCAGIAFGFWTLRDVVIGTATQTVGPGSTVKGADSALAIEWLVFARALLKAAVIVGLLVAVTKYCFTLGKAYMSEALKSADRIHAISYGRFYLRAFGAYADPQQLKDVFQYWNIDRPSAFSTTTTDQFDPKYAEAIIELAKAFNKSAEKKP
jgi:hypothetical protein